jgi:hypothetical protein
MRQSSLRPLDCFPLSSNTRTPKAHLHTVFLTLTPMSHTHPTASSSSSCNFQLIINNALDTYQKRTKKDLRTHPLADRLQSCNSPGAIIAVLQEQIQGLDQSRGSDERWSKWLDPTVNVLQAFSSILAAGASLVWFRIFVRVVPSHFMKQAFPPANVIFAGVGVLLSVSILNNPIGLCIITRTSLRHLRILELVVMLLSTFLSASKCFSDESRFTQKRSRPQK